MLPLDGCIVIGKQQGVKLVLHFHAILTAQTVKVIDSCGLEIVYKCHNRLWVEACQVPQQLHHTHKCELYLTGVFCWWESGCTCAGSPSMWIPVPMYTPLLWNQWSSHVVCHTSRQAVYMQANMNMINTICIQT